MHFAVRTVLTGIFIVSGFPAGAVAQDNIPALSGFIGAGASVKPKYSGAKESKVSFLPVLKVEYGPFFVGGVDTLTAAGWKFYDTAHWQFSLGVGSDLFPRQEADDDRLKGMGDIAVTPRAFASGSFKSDYFTGGLILTQDIGGNEQGFRLTSYAHASWQATQDLQLFAGPVLSWADSDYMQTQYGVSSTQSRRSGLSRYQASSGWDNVGIEMGVDYQFARDWMWGARAFAQHIEEASASPVVQKDDHLSYGMFVSWRF